MKKPDILLFLTMFVIIGASLTSIAAKERQTPTAVASEYSIR